jgi:hypothetical protein
MQTSSSHQCPPAHLCYYSYRDGSTKDSFISILQFMMIACLGGIWSHVLRRLPSRKPHMGKTGPTERPAILHVLPTASPTWFLPLWSSQQETDYSFSSHSYTWQSPNVAFHSGRVRFKSRSGIPLSWLMVSVVILGISQSVRCLGYRLGPKNRGE